MHGTLVLHWEAFGLSIGDSVIRAKEGCGLSVLRSAGGPPLIRVIPK